MTLRELTSQLIDSIAFRDMVVDKLYEIVARDLGALEERPDQNFAKNGTVTFIQERRAYVQSLVALAGNVNVRLANQNGIGGYIRFSAKTIAPTLTVDDYSGLANDGVDASTKAYIDGLADTVAIQVAAGQVCDSTVNLIAGIEPFKIAAAHADGVWSNPS